MKIIAHRGANKIAPQNTLSAFRLAREMKIDGFETDVHFTKDRKVVLCHNPDIDETSNGTGFVNDLTFDELRSYDFGSCFSRDFAGEKIPELSEFLEIAAGLEIINIEIKTPHDHDYTIVDETIRQVKEAGLAESLLISSFDPVVLRRSRDIDPDIKTGLLYDFTKKVYREFALDPVGFALGLGCKALHPFMYLIDRRTIKKAHANGMQVNCWTVDDTLSAGMLRAVGADGLITDLPNKLESFCD